MNAKRGLSDIVTTVLIILLVLASVVIIWTFVRPAIQSGAGKVSGACVSLDLSIEKCSGINLGNGNYSANVTVKRGAEDVTLEETVLVFDLEDSTTKAVEGLSKVDELGKTTFLQNQIGDFIKPASKVTVTGKVRTEAGDLILCDPTAVKVSCT